MTDQPPKDASEDFESSLLADIERFSGVDHKDLAPPPEARHSSIAEATALVYPSLLGINELKPLEEIAKEDKTLRNIDGRAIPEHMLPPESLPDADPVAVQAALMNRWLADAKSFFTRLVTWLNANPVETPHTFDLDARRNLGPLKWVKGSISGGGALDPTLMLKFILQGGAPLEVSGRNAEIEALEARCRELGAHVERISGKGAAAPGILPKVRVIRGVRAQLQISQIPGTVQVLIRARNFAGRPSLELTYPPEELDHALLQRLADDLCGPTWRDAHLEDPPPEPKAPSNLPPPLEWNV